MKTNTIPTFFLTIILIFIFHFFTQGQVTDTVASGRNDAKTSEAIESVKIVDDITSNAGLSFKDGLVAMSDNRRSVAGEKFNKSVEAFLMSGINVSRNPKLQSCYNQLVETVYRIEFPSNAQQPQIRSLSVICGWKWNENDYRLADAVAKHILTMATTIVGENTPTQGYNEQKFEVSSLDELSKPELIPEENEITNNKVAQKQYQYITYPLVKTGFIRIVKAKTGDTVAKLAEREGVSAVEIAKYNGVPPTSLLSVGRKIKIPSISESGQNNAQTGNTSVTNSKEEATCKTSTSPVIQNLRLGMTINEVSKKISKNITVKKLPNVSPETYFAMVSNLKGVRQLSLNFFKGKLFLIKVYYDNSIEWNGIFEFQKIVSKTLNIPNVWKGEYSFEKQILCTNFDIKIVNLSSNNFSLAVTDNNVIQDMVDEMVLNEKKRREREKSKKENFKP